METKWFQIEVFLSTTIFFQKIFSEWKLFMANIFCKNWFSFQVEIKKKMLIKLVPRTQTVVEIPLNKLH